MDPKEIPERLTAVKSILHRFPGLLQMLTKRDPYHYTEYIPIFNGLGVPDDDRFLMQQAYEDYRWLMSP